MKFNSLPYLILLLSTLVVFFNLPGRRSRLLLLIGASLVFYAWWSIPLVSLIFISAAVDFTAGRMIGATEETQKRRGWLLLSICVNLGLLGFFKYANFFADNVRAVLGDSSTARIVNVVLPPGISFYTFQTMSYTIDVYRRQIRPTRSFLRFFLYVCFFPQLVAGPIERAGHLLTQFDAAVRARFSAHNLLSGSRMIVFGLFKKVIIADWCATIVDRVYANPTDYGGWSALVATWAFSLQIYCDFSAYSEIARGSARLFGIDLIRNFDQPYLAANMSDFWRRWHISLSTWIRDYLYIPLGGSRGTVLRAMRNLAITMFLSGLWHGAAWNFVLWGLFHGLLLVLGFQWSRTVLVRRTREGLPRIWPLVAWIASQHMVLVGWILFRVDRLGDFPVILSRIGRALTGSVLPNTWQIGFLGFVAAFLGISYLGRRYRLIQRIDSNTAISVVFYSALIVAMLLFARTGGPQFIYFQF